MVARRGCAGESRGGGPLPKRQARLPRNAKTRRKVRHLALNSPVGWDLRNAEKIEVVGVDEDVCPRLRCVVVDCEKDRALLGLTNIEEQPLYCAPQNEADQTSDMTAATA